MKTIRRFPSKRNDVRLLISDRRPVVEKVFTDCACAEKEASVYELLRGHTLLTPRLLAVKSDRLLLSYLPGTDFVTLLEQQERTQVEALPWRLLAEWLLEFHRLTGLIMEDVNLRNYLYLPDERAVAGLDFEQCAPGAPIDMMARLCAFIWLYDPPFTSGKKAVVQEIESCLVSNKICRADALREKSAGEIERLQGRRRKT